jgi:DNA-binding transcriptional regulator GbsR (MarR family)
MTQASLINALANGPLTSREVAEITGMSQATVISTARKLRTQGKLTAKLVKSGKFWVNEYTLTEDAPKPSQTVFFGIQTKGIFSQQEYRAMKTQLSKMYKNHDFSRDITNNQRI